MEFNAQQQCRPSSNGSYAMHHSSPAPGSQMMYPYNGLPQQGQQQQAQPMQHMSRPSPPQPTWAVPQTHNPYYQMPRSQAMSSREDARHMLGRSDIVTAQSPVSSNTPFTNSMHGSNHLATTDYFPGVIDTSPWGQKVCEELESFPSLDPEVGDYNHGLIAHDENTPIIDLRQYPGMGHQEHEGQNTFNPHSSRRLSESSFSMSSTGGVLPEVSTYDDIGTSEVVSYTPEYDAWNNQEPMTSQLLSPLASPRRPQPQHEHIARGGSRSRASPAPHNNVRSSPYTLDSTRMKRWSTGQAPTSTPARSALSHVPDRFAPYGPRYNPHHSMPVYPSPAYNSYGQATPNSIYAQTPPLYSSNHTLFSNHEQSHHLEVPRPLPSQGLFRLLQSNADRHGGCSSHFADLSDPPDLYSSLHEEPSNPPESDMNSTDPDLVPHEQDLRFTGDLYTPRWVRGHGNKREGWCGLCKPGRWLVLKNSAFWYDKSFTHGVSAATGAAFQGPQDTRRTEGNLDVWEGLCGSCGEWIALVSSKKKGTTWFRHAYKCHTHPKVKDGPKRRRETQAGRVRAASSASANSSSYQIKQEDTVVHRHSTPTPITGSASLQSFGMPTASSSLPLPTSTPTSTPQLNNASNFASNTAYPTPNPGTPNMHSHRTPTQASFPDYREPPSTQQEPVIGMFTTPLQSLQGFSGNPQSYSRVLAHQVSEPELVGIRTTTTTLNSIASMI
ncbi:hypothetical protein HBI81_185810 [Parastagonospora nodorum]|nr:hypothetical protein HBH52_213080 [Parastagonospora nodorum]KAH4044060.1 hypothetical protein HBH49_224800 [Parastagonospora nodorum]KAH4157145.1 hypothetical protein HBH43_203390 [Parastagonospora nodorum]KAH5469145.1 hypothetical protein HBI31_196750 [Parastagonospora nodorum]KAH6330338.1 hypothetical protein HBI37_187900 [Parastagonospora nodorum]